MQPRVGETAKIKVYSDRKASKNQLKNHSKKWWVFQWIFDSKSTLKWSQNGSKKEPKRPTEIIRKINAKFIEKWSQNGPQTGPKGSQNADQVPTKCRHNPAADQKSQKGAKMETKWSQNGAKRDPKSSQNGTEIEQKRYQK